MQNLGQHNQCLCISVLDEAFIKSFKISPSHDISRKTIKYCWFTLTNLYLAPVFPALLESHHTSWWCPHGENNHNRIWCQLPHATSQRRSVNSIQVLEARGQLKRRFSVCYPDSLHTVQISSVPGSSSPPASRPEQQPWRQSVCRPSLWDVSQVLLSQVQQTLWTIYTKAKSGNLFGAASTGTQQESQTSHRLGNIWFFPFTVL